MRAGFSTLRTELFHLLVIPFLAHHPVKANRQFSCHRHPGNLPSPPHGQVEKPAAPLRITADRDLRRLHQQETQQRVALFGDVSQSSPISARVLFSTVVV